MPKGIEKKLDDAWSMLVKLKGGMKCAYCGKTTTLNSHHIYSRSKKSVRWDTDNGICLCVAHHTFSTQFSAHKTPTEFTYWLEKERGKQFMIKLEAKARTMEKLHKFEKEEKLDLLIAQIECFELNEKQEEQLKKIKAGRK